MCTASLAETMAQSVCSFQPAIAIIPWVKPLASVTAIKKDWLIFVFEGRCNIFFAGSPALLIDLRVGPNDLAVVAVQPLGNSDVSNTLSHFPNNRYNSQNYVYEFGIYERNY